MKLVSVRVTAMFILVILSLLVMMHGLILLGVIPHAIVWGGQIDDPKQLPVFEATAMLALVAFGLIVLLRAGWLGNQKLYKVSHVIMWLLVVYFALNTVGNLAASDMRERFIFTPVTVLLVLASLRLSLARPE